MHGATLTLTILILVSAITMFYSLRLRHIERMARIEHGMEEIHPGFVNSPYFSLGIFLCALGLSIFASYLLSSWTNLPDYVLIPGCLLLFGGGSLFLIAYLGKPKND